MYEIIITKLQSMGKTHKYTDDASRLMMYNNEEYIIAVWNPDALENEIKQQSNIVNLLNHI